MGEKKVWKKESWGSFVNFPQRRFCDASVIFSFNIIEREMLIRYYKVQISWQCFWSYILEKEIHLRIVQDKVYFRSLFLDFEKILWTIYLCQSFPNFIILFQSNHKLANFDGDRYNSGENSQISFTQLLNVSNPSKWDIYFGAFLFEIELKHFYKVYLCQIYFSKIILLYTGCFF